MNEAYLVEVEDRESWLSVWAAVSGFLYGQAPNSPRASTPRQESSVKKDVRTEIKIENGVQLSNNK